MNKESSEAYSEEQQSSGHIQLRTDGVWTVDPNQYEHKHSGEEFDRLLKKVALLEDIVLMGNKVSLKEHGKQMAGGLLQARLAVKKNEVLAGEVFTLELDLANFGRSPATLEGIEEILPCCGIEFAGVRDRPDLDGSYLDLSGKELKPSMTEKLKFKIRPYEKGIYVIAPRLVYRNELGVLKTLSPEPATVEVKRAVLPNRISSGYQSLDDLLLGGIPEKLAVVLTSIACDETRLLVNRFIEKGVREKEITILITVDAGRWESLAEEFSNFSIFVCNPQMMSTMKSLANIVRIRGLENLTDISIPLTTALRRFSESSNKPRRVIIEILSDILLQHRAVQTRKWLIGLIAQLKSKGFTILAVLNPKMHNAEEVQAVLDLFDGELGVYKENDQWFVQVRRMYEQDYLNDALPLRKDRLSTMGITRKLKYHNF